MGGVRWKGGLEALAAMQKQGTIKGFTINNLQTGDVKVNEEQSVLSPGSSKERMQALGRMKDGKMNNTEKKYEAMLEQRLQAGEVLWYAFEPMNLRLAANCFYRVDFMVMLSGGELEVHEVKGFWTDDALVKIKVAAELFPFRFIAMQYKKKGWVTREF